MSAAIEQSVSVCPPILRSVQPFPPVASRLLRLVADENDDFSYRDAAKLVSADAAFAADVLRLANSPLFGFRHQIKDISHAIAVLGLNRLRAIVTTLALTEFIGSRRREEVVQRCWRHNMATALAAETLAGAFWVESGLGYTAGLLHDIGLLALVTIHADRYAELFSRELSDPRQFLDRERLMVGIDHCSAGDWLLSDWALPEEFRAAAAEHHLEPDSKTSDIVRVVQLACRTATMSGFSLSDSREVWEPELIIDSLPAITQERYRVKLEDLPLAIATKINSFDCDYQT